MSDAAWPICWIDCVAAGVEVGVDLRDRLIDVLHRGLRVGEDRIEILQRGSLVVDGESRNVRADRRGALSTALAAESSETAAELIVTSALVVALDHDRRRRKSWRRRSRRLASVAVRCCEVLFREHLVDLLDRVARDAEQVLAALEELVDQRAAGEDLGRDAVDRHKQRLGRIARGESG